MLRTDLPEIMTKTLPGPKAAKIIERREAVVPSAIRCAYPVVIEKGEMVADADFYSNSARIGVKNHIDTDTETASETHTGAKATASSAKVAIANHIERDTEAQSPAFMGCCATSNLARITIPLHCSDEQSDMDAVIYGTNAYASSAHIVVATK